VDEDRRHAGRQVWVDSLRRRAWAAPSVNVEQVNIGGHGNSLQRWNASSTCDRGRARGRTLRRPVPMTGRYCSARSWARSATSSSTGSVPAPRLRRPGIERDRPGLTRGGAASGTATSPRTRSALGCSQPRSTCRQLGTAATGGRSEAAALRPLTAARRPGAGRR
jgi:hypothetical protein